MATRSGIVDQEMATITSILAYSKPGAEGDYFRGILEAKGWRSIDDNRDDRKRPTLQSVLGNNYNIEGNANNEVINRFEIFVNPDTKQIAIAFKGTDNIENAKSDVTDGGYSTLEPFMFMAQMALDTLRKMPEYRDYSITATGHSLGAVGAQVFGLANKLHVSTINPLPLANGFKTKGYFDPFGGFDELVQQRLGAGLEIHQLETPFDIATGFYGLGNYGDYLIDTLGGKRTVLPGSTMPPATRFAFLFTGLGAVAEGINHGCVEVWKALQGLTFDPSGTAIIPENGHENFAQIPADLRKLLLLDDISNARVVNVRVAQETDESISYYIDRNDGSKQGVVVDKRTGSAVLQYVGKDDVIYEIEAVPDKGNPLNVVYSIRKFDSAGELAESVNIEGDSISHHQSVR